ncbi:MAG: hypothetical protein GX568_10855 [Candidatus Gastranaerophilales bacterium]|nr:hypothetical protein [Candidatus Gastranaerophilales bacterium]
MQKVIKSLENGTYRKIICGAANTSEQQIERMSLVYSLCGADVIDIAPQREMYEAAKRGISMAAEIVAQNPELFPKFKPSLIMKSINVGDDKHFRKANFNLAQCVQCLDCVKACQSGALTVDDGKKSFNQQKCYGCAMCVESCQHNAVSMVMISDNPFATGDFPEKPDAIELHTGNSSIEKVKAFVELHKNVLNKVGIISISVDTMRFNAAELVDYATALLEMFDRKIIIQADGVSMRGGSRKSSTLPTLSAALVLFNAGIDAYIQLSGGTNHLTQKFVDMTDLKIAGIGFGTFAKKIILNYIEEYSDDEFVSNLQQITAIAGKLFE